LDLDLVPFHGPPLRLLRAPAKAAQEAPHVIDMVGYAEAIADDPGHSGARPQVRWEPCLLGAPEQDPLEASLRWGIQLRGTARSRFRPQALVADFPVHPVPAPNAAPVDPHHVRHFDGLTPLKEEVDSTNSTMFQFLWASGRSHGLPPAQIIGH